MEPDAELVTVYDSLYNVVEHITLTDTEQLKFLCLDIIPIGTLEKMDIAELLKSLNERNIIAKDKFDFLAVCLILIGRIDIVQMIGYKDSSVEELSHQLKKYNTIAGLEAFRILLFNLADNLTKEEVKKIIFFLDEKLNYSKGKMKMCITGFDLMTVFVKAHYVSPQNLRNLYYIAEQLDRQDLVKKIEMYSDNNKESIAISKGIAQETSKEIKPVTTGINKDTQQHPYDLNEVSDWEQLIKHIPERRQYDLCAQLNIPPKKIKIFKNNLEKLLYKYFTENLFSTPDLESAFKKLDIKMPLLHANKKGSSFPEKELTKYVMTSKPRGICLIINNVIFKNTEHKERKGSDVDKEALMQIFRTFHFKIIVAENLEKAKMEKKLREIASEDHKQYNCFVCCILSHGKEGGVFGVDGELLPFKMLTLPFKPNNCPSLNGKPKLFFIQACQGQIYQLGTEEYETDGVYTPTPLIPNEADFLMAYATVYGYVSFRSMTKGSWFIQKLCEVFLENAKRLDLSDMLLMVNNSVSQCDGNIKNKPTAKQVPAPLSTLRKKVFFLDESE